MLCAPDGYFGDLATTPRPGSRAGTDTDDQSVADGADLALHRLAVESDRQVPAHASDEGCSLATGASAAWPGLGWLALAGLLAARRRRRTRVTAIP